LGRLFGNDEDRITAFKGEAVETEDWGGSTLDDHHSFIVQYRPTDDKKLGRRGPNQRFLHFYLHVCVMSLS
jgi:hypothetical protein